MKILLTVFECMDIGGIGTDVDWKIRGLQEAGHKVDIIMLKNADMDPKMRGRTTQVGATEGPNGLQIHPRAGFFGLPIICYGSKERLKKLHQRFAKYDVIIHEIPGPDPAKTADSRGYWHRLYDHDTPQIISAHDANFRDLYPYLIKVAPFIKGISCTNQAGYANLSWFPAPRAFIGAPHPVFDWESLPSWDDRKPRAVCAHVWKAWKHMDYVVRAVPRLKESTVVMCGDGIERNYMTSANKRKEKYGDIWERAIEAGMRYEGMLPAKKLHSLYRHSRVMVDMAWSNKFANLGCHFNRSIIEGYNNGCVPIVVTENMYEEGFQRQMFIAGKTHFEIAADHKPRELAQLIDHVANLPAEEADQIIARGRKILTRFFDYRKTSLQYLDLAAGNPAGVYPKLETGKLNKKIVAAADRYMDGKVARAIAKKNARSNKGDEE
jgi:glycosyltransferase involved in cell wall biosynthesis